MLFRTVVYYYLQLRQHSSCIKMTALFVVFTKVKDLGRNILLYTQQWSWVCYSSSTGL